MVKLQEAIRLADLGYRVFPCRPGGKEPMTAHGCKDATSDSDQICEWWEEWPDANIGVSTDGLLVVDVDPLPNGVRNEFADDIDRLAELLVSAGTSTPRGGTHFWFRDSTGELRNTTGRIADGVDTRATGGYVLAPPSQVGDGEYRWMYGFALESSPEKLKEPPAWILDALGAQPAAKPEITIPADNSFPEGTRNQSLTSIGGQLRRIGMSESAIAVALRATNMERCKPPLDDAEVQKIAWSVSRYEPNQIATAIAEGWADQDKRQPPENKDPGPLPKELLQPGGFLGEVIDWNVRTAFKPQEELALAAALALLSVLTGRKICDERGTRTNIYCLGVCDSGGGKEYARKVNKAILNAGGLDHLIGPEGIGSSTGLLSALSHQPCQLFQIDEFGRFLATLNNPSKSPFLYNIVGVLLKLFSSADSMFIGDAVADRKRVPKIDQPHAVLYATTVPKNFLESLQVDSLTDGFLSRLLVFDSSRSDPDSQETVSQSVPREIAEQAAWWGQYTAGGNLAGVNPQPRAVVATDEAKAVFRDLEMVSRSKSREERQTSKIWTRTGEKARKLALLHQVSLDRDSTEIRQPSADWGCHLSYCLTERLEYLATDWVSENTWEATCKRLLREIRKAGLMGLTATELTRRMQFLRPRERTEMLQTLTDSGQIESFKEQSGGRPRLVYRLRNCEVYQGG